MPDNNVPGVGGMNGLAGSAGTPTWTAGVPGAEASGWTKPVPQATANYNIAGNPGNLGQLGYSGQVTGTVNPIVTAMGPPPDAWKASAMPNTPVPTATGTPVPQGPAIYGANGNQTLGEFQQWQADEFNKNQLAAQGQFNAFAPGMANPYDQYVANPASPGKASAAFSSPANATAWQQSGLSSQLANPNPGFSQAQGQGSDYQRNQLMFLLRTLANYGAGGQNRFGNSYSPVFTGQPNNQSLLNGLGNSSGNPGGYQAGNGGQGGGLGLAQLLPLLIGLAQNTGQGPAAGSYGNLGVPSVAGQTPSSDIYRLLAERDQVNGTGTELL